MRLFLGLASVLLATAPAAAATPSEDFHALMDDYWATYLRDNPADAAYAGVPGHERELGVISLADFDHQASEAAQFLKQLAAIDPKLLGTADQTNYAILKRTLSEVVETNGFGERQMLFNSIFSIHQFWSTLGERDPFHSYADYDNYLAVIAQMPAQLANYAAISRKAASEGYVHPCGTLVGFEMTITGVIAMDPTRSPFYEPFATPKPSFVTTEQWAALQQRARQEITSRLNPAYANWARIYREEVAPKCRQSIAVTSLPQGRDYYAMLVRSNTTTNLTPEQIHVIGMREVGRIGGKMDALARSVGYTSRAAMIEHMRTDPDYFAKSPEQLLAAAALITKTIDGRLLTLFTRLPRAPFGIRPIATAAAANNTTGYYVGGSPETGVAGTFYINTSSIGQRPLWELPVLTAHEAEPGHHLQIATQQELSLPAWRKFNVFYTAFTEGWGLYAEDLGEEIGIYDTPEKKMGRLSYEMWRACRLVVDTGIHAQGWSKGQAIAYMKGNTALTDANIAAEVNRYISNPGQALAYKIGELKILELRARAQHELGSKFDLRRFNDAVISEGAVPLDLLETQIDGWIASQKGSPSPKPPRPIMNWIFGS